MAFTKYARHGTRYSPTLPLRTLRQVSTRFWLVLRLRTDVPPVFLLVITFLHSLSFNTGTFYLALYFQTVQGLLPLAAGLAMLPYSLGSSVASMPGQP